MAKRELRDLILEVIEEHHHVSPARIVSYDPDNLRARVKLKWRDEQDQSPVIEDAPVMAIRAGGVSIVPPYQEGDQVICVFSDVDLESTLSDKDHRQPIRVRASRLQYCIVMGGVLVDTDDISLSGDSDALRIGDDQGNGVLQVDSNGEIKLISSTVELGDGTLEGLIKESFQTVFNTHTHPSPAGGSTGQPSSNLDQQHITEDTQGS